MTINQVSVSPPVQSAGEGDDLQNSLWKHNEDGVYVMAQTASGQYRLVSLTDGNRWTEPDHHGGDPFGRDRHEFTRIPPGSTVSITVGEARP